MKCDKFEYFSSLYLDNCLSEKGRLEFELHLSQCKKCSANYKVMQIQRELLTNCDKVNIPEAVTRELNKKLYDPLIKQKRWIGLDINIYPLKYLPQAAGIIFVISLSIVYFVSDSIKVGTINQNAVMSKKSDNNHIGNNTINQKVRRQTVSIPQEKSGEQDKLVMKTEPVEPQNIVAEQPKTVQKSGVNEQSTITRSVEIDNNIVETEKQLQYQQQNVAKQSKKIQPLQQKNREEKNAKNIIDKSDIYKEVDTNISQPISSANKQDKTSQLRMSQKRDATSNQNMLRVLGNKLALNGSDKAKIQYYLKDEATFVRLKIYNVAGEIVRIINCDIKTGWATVEWDGKNDKDELVSAGVYFIYLDSDIEKKLMQKMIVIK